VTKKKNKPRVIGEPSGGVRLSRKNFLTGSSRSSLHQRSSTLNHRRLDVLRIYQKSTTRLQTTLWESSEPCSRGLKLTVIRTY
jgi:hypothetical protein